MGIKFLGNSEKQNPLLLAWKFGNRPVMLRPGTGNSTAAIGSPDQVNSSTAERQAVEDARSPIESRVYWTSLLHIPPSFHSQASVSCAI